MVIKSRHPEYDSDKARMEKLREMKQLCRQKLAAVQAGKKVN